MLIFAGCKDTAVPKITLVIQDGFSGVVILRWQQSQGAKLPPESLGFTLSIPSSGILEIQGKNLTLDWHVLEARYAGGKVLLQGNQHTKDNSGVFLWDMGANADASESWYVVGKIDDLDGVLERKMGLAPFPKK
jgi:hypothetical protein